MERATDTYNFFWNGITDAEKIALHLMAAYGPDKALSFLKEYASGLRSLAHVKTMVKELVGWIEAYAPFIGLHFLAAGIEGSSLLLEKYDAYRDYHYDYVVHFFEGLAAHLNFDTQGRLRVASSMVEHMNQWTDHHLNDVTVLHPELPLDEPEQRIAQRILKQYRKEQRGHQGLTAADSMLVHQLTQVIQLFIAVHEKQNVFNIEALGSYTARGFEPELDSQTGSWALLYAQLAACITVTAKGLVITAEQRPSWAAWWQHHQQQRHFLDKHTQRQHQQQTPTLLHQLAQGHLHQLPSQYLLDDSDIRSMVKLFKEAFLITSWVEHISFQKESIYNAIQERLQMAPAHAFYLWMNTATTRQHALNEPGSHWLYLKVNVRDSILHICCCDSSPAIDDEQGAYYQRYHNVVGSLNDIVLPIKHHDYTIKVTLASPTVYERQNDSWSCGFRLLLGILRDNFVALTAHEQQRYQHHLKTSYPQGASLLLQLLHAATIDPHHALAALFGYASYRGQWQEQQLYTWGLTKAELAQRFEPGDTLKHYRFKAEVLQNFFKKSALSTLLKEKAATLDDGLVPALPSTPSKLPSPFHHWVLSTDSYHLSYMKQAILGAIVDHDDERFQRYYLHNETTHLNDEQETALHIALRYQRPELVHSILQSLTPSAVEHLILQPNRDGDTPLHYAYYHKDAHARMPHYVEDMSLFFKNHPGFLTGLRPEEQQVYQNFQLPQAVLRILEMERIKTWDYFKASYFQQPITWGLALNAKHETFLHLVLRHQQLSLVLDILQHLPPKLRYVLVNQPTAAGHTPLHYAAYYLPNARLLQILLQYGAKLHHCGGTLAPQVQGTALHALMAGLKALPPQQGIFLIELMLNAGADVSQINADGWCAHDMKLSWTFAYFTKKKAELAQRMAYSVAHQAWPTECLNHPSWWAVPLNDHHDTLLHLAIRSTADELMVQLVQPLKALTPTMQERILSQRNHLGNTPLHEAILYQLPQTVEWLLHLGAPLTYRNQAGHYPHHLKAGWDGRRNHLDHYLHTLRQNFEQGATIDHPRAVELLSLHADYHSLFQYHNEASLWFKASLPDVIQQLRSLTLTSLNGHSMRILAPALARLSFLEVLNVSHTHLARKAWHSRWLPAGITSLVTVLRQLHHLKHFILQQGQLRGHDGVELIEGLSHHPQLTHLEVDHNPFSPKAHAAFATAMATLPRLRRFSLMATRLQTLEAQQLLSAFRGHRNARQLNLQHNPDIDPTMMDAIHQLEHERRHRPLTLSQVTPQLWQSLPQSFPLSSSLAQEQLHLAHFDTSSIMVCWSTSTV